MTSRICIYALAFVAAIPAFRPVFGQAVTPRLLRFEEPVREIGTVKKENGSLTLNFEYTNIADKPVVIRNIHSQCGMCLNGEYGTRPLAPGKSSVVVVTFDPETKYGPFKISLTVIASNGDYNKYSTLTVKGNVISDVTIEDQRYKYRYSAAVRSDKRVVGMRLITDKGNKVTRGLEMYNFSDKEVVTTFSHGSRFLEGVAATKIAPGEASEVMFTLDPLDMPEGEFTIPVKMKIDGIEAEDIIEVKGKIETR